MPAGMDLTHEGKYMGAPSRNATHEAVSYLLQRGGVPQQGLGVGFRVTPSYPNRLDVS